MRTVPISIDWAEVSGRSEQDGYRNYMLGTDAMAEIMRGCMLGLERLTNRTRSLVTSVKVRPRSTPSGCWPKAPIEPIDYEIKVMLFGPPHAGTGEGEELKAEKVLESKDDAERQTVDRIAHFVEILVSEAVLSRAAKLRQRADSWTYASATT